MRGIAKHKRGAVSIFVVVFTALLITVVTVSFARLMLSEQQRASNMDLSQSAYDAALAGVEDAKRVLSINPNATGLNSCNGLAPALGITPATEGVRVGNASLQQWYSCVKIQTDTPSYEKPIGADETVLVPLRATGDITSVAVEWFSKDDMSTGSPSSQSGAGEPILAQAWPQNRPSVLETQLIQTDRAGFTLKQFDPPSVSNESNVSTLILYPWQITASPLAFTNDVRLSSANDAPTKTSCVNNFNNVYACRATIQLPSPIGGGTRANDTAFLRLTPRYKGAHVRVSLTGPSTPMFQGVQPLVDSTGRAGDLFRRVKARIEPTGGIYPEAAIDVTNNFCKTFQVTDSIANYSTGTCYPGEAGNTP